MSNDNNTKFRQDYAKSLAQALKEKPEQRPKDEVIRETYTALCFDEPQVMGGDDACRLLATALEKEKSLYAISDPLIDGIVQVTSRTTSAVASTVQQEEENDEEEEIVWHTEGVATAAGHALLAFTCFVKIPLACCHSSDINTVIRLLGSYRGPKRRQAAEVLTDGIEALLAKENEDDARIKALSDGMSNMATTNDSSDDKKQEYHEYEEVWAAESDPSDYEYESGAQTVEPAQWEQAAFDPEALSKPPSTQSDWNDLSQAIMNLLSQLTYSKLAPLSKQKWQSLNVSSLLSQLALTLLIQPENSSPLIHQNDELQQLGIQPLYVLRDRVAAGHPEVLEDYLQLLQTLMAVDAAAEPRSTNDGSLAPATIVGLTALSALCCVSNKTTAQRIRQCVLQVSEDLSHVMEKSLQGTDDQSRIIWTLLPLLDRLVNITPQGTIWEASCGSLTNADAQLLLQTGVFRQVILLYCDGGDDVEDVSTEAARMQLLRCIQVMCIQSTTLLGKYAWRVPDMARVVQSEEFALEHTVDGMLWNLLGSSVAGGPVRLVMKNVPAALTVEDCRPRVKTGFEQLCKNAEGAMDEIQRLRTSKTKDASRDDISSDWKEPIQELSRFTNYLVSCPSLATLWRSAITLDGESKQHVKTTIDSLRTRLSKLPRIPETTKPNNKTTKTSENDKAGDPLERNPAFSFGEHEEAAVRKALKILSASGRADSAAGSSKTD